jgi:hypothetical protein
MTTRDKLTYVVTFIICTIISIVYLRKTLTPPDLRVTKRMIREAELGVYFGDDYELEDEDDDDEIVDL